jgi:hypothetical protein
MLNVSHQLGGGGGGGGGGVGGVGLGGMYSRIREMLTSFCIQRQAFLFTFSYDGCCRLNTNIL